MMRAFVKKLNAYTVSIVLILFYVVVFFFPWILLSIARLVRKNDHSTYWIPAKSEIDLNSPY